MYVGMDTFHLVLSPPTEECEACEENVLQCSRHPLLYWIRSCTSGVIFSFDKLIAVTTIGKWQFASTAWYYRIF